MSKISVVMPVYNGEKYLPAAIDSVLSQSYQDFEFIIVEECGNSDICHEILQDYANRDHRIKIIENTRRLGISESLNVGLSHASGKYIARMDGDDVCGLDRFKVQMEYMDQNSAIDICGIIPTVMNSPNWILESSSDPEIVKSSCPFGVPLKHPTIMIRSDTFFNKNMQYNGSLMGCEDFDLFFRASFCLKMTNLREPSLFMYRRTSDNASSVFKERDLKIGHQLLKKAYKENYNIALNEFQLQGIWVSCNWTSQNANKILKEIESLFRKMENNSSIKRNYLSDALQDSMRRKWRKIYTQIMSNKDIALSTKKKVEETYKSSAYFWI